MKMVDFSGGMNTLQPPEKIEDNEFTELLNVCFDEGNILRSRHGFKNVLSATTVRKIYPLYVGTTLQLIYTCADGLYANSTLLDADFTGPFVAAEYGAMLYLTNGTYFKRYDGATLYNVGIDAPDAPTVTPVITGQWNELDIDDFEDATVQYTKGSSPFNGGTSGDVSRNIDPDYIVETDIVTGTATGGSTTTLTDTGVTFTALSLEVGMLVWNVTDDGYGYISNIAANTLTVDPAFTNAASFAGGGDDYRIVKEYASLKVVCSAGQSITATRVLAADLDLTEFSGESVVAEDQMVFRIKANKREWLESIEVKFDLSDGAAWQNYYVSPAKILPNIKYESPTYRDAYERGASENNGLVIDEFMADWEYLVLPEDRFGFLVIPKGDFKRVGSDTSLGWDAVKRISFTIYASATAGDDDLEVYIDKGQLLGLIGGTRFKTNNYYFVAGYYNSTRNEYYGISEESDPVEIEMNTVTISGVPATFPDAQADQYIVWARKDSWIEWRLFATFDEGTTSQDVVIRETTLIVAAALTEQTGMFPLPRRLESGEIRTRDNSNNLPPPVGTYIVFHRGKLFVLSGADIYHSKAGQPWAMPYDFHLEGATSSDPFQVAYADGSNLAIHTKARDLLYMNPGEYDGFFFYMGFISEAKKSVGCISPHSAHMGIFASAQGLAVRNGAEATILTDRIQPTYLAITDKTALHGAVYENFYFLANPNGRSIVMERYGDGVRFYEWDPPGTVRCCAVDIQENRLYIGTNNGIYYYDKDRDYDTESFSFIAKTKKLEFAPVDEDAPLERMMLHCNPSGNELQAEFLVDEVVHGTVSSDEDEKTEVEDFFDLGAAGSFVEVHMEAEITNTAPVRIYAIEAS